MTDPEDLGSRISRLAKALTKGQLAEMLAIHRLDLFYRKTRTPIIDLHRNGPVYGPLIEGEMIWWKQTRKQSGVSHLTELGQRVMLCRIRYDLEAAGALPIDEEIEYA